MNPSKKKKTVTFIKVGANLSQIFLCYQLVKKKKCLQTVSYFSLAKLKTQRIKFGSLKGALCRFRGEI